MNNSIDYHAETAGRRVLKVDPSGYVVPRRIVVESVRNIPSHDLPITLRRLRILFEAIGSGRRAFLSEPDKSALGYVIDQITNEQNQEVLTAILTACKQGEEQIEAAMLTLALMINVAMDCSKDEPVNGCGLESPTTEVKKRNE